MKKSNVRICLTASLNKRQNALNRFKARKKAFLIDKAEIIKEIEEAREIWKTTMAQLPDSDFSQ